MLSKWSTVSFFRKMLLFHFSSRFPVPLLEHCVSCSCLDWVYNEKQQSSDRLFPFMSFNLAVFWFWNLYEIFVCGENIFEWPESGHFTRESSDLAALFYQIPVVTKSKSWCFLKHPIRWPRYSAISRSVDPFYWATCSLLALLPVTKYRFN